MNAVRAINSLYFALGSFYLTRTIVRVAAWCSRGGGRLGKCASIDAAAGRSVIRLRDVITLLSPIPFIALMASPLTKMRNAFLMAACAALSTRSAPGMCTSVSWSMPRQPYPPLNMFIFLDDALQIAFVVLMQFHLLDLVELWACARVPVRCPALTRSLLTPTSP